MRDQICYLKVRDWSLQWQAIARMTVTEVTQ